MIGRIAGVPGMLRSRIDDGRAKPIGRIVYAHFTYRQFLAGQQTRWAQRRWRSKPRKSYGHRLGTMAETLT
jgi:hypothetical protein